jgi:hypothetical protein
LTPGTGRKKIASEVKYFMKKTATTILLCLVLAGCAAHRVGTPPGQTPAPITTAEQANFDNAQVAIHLRAIGKVIRAAHDAAFIDRAGFDVLTSGEAKLLRLHQQLTPLLKNWPASGPTADTKTKIAEVLGQVKQVAFAMVSTGVVGVKNPDSQAALTADINAIINLAVEILNVVEAFKPVAMLSLGSLACPMGMSEVCLKQEVYHVGQ